MASFPFLSNLGFHFFGSDGKESACNEGDQGSIPGLGRSPGGGPGNPLQYSGLENPPGQRSLVGCSPWGCKELDTTERLSRELGRGAFSTNTRALCAWESSLPQHQSFMVSPEAQTRVSCWRTSLNLRQRWCCLRKKGWAETETSVGERNMRHREGNRRETGKKGRNKRAQGEWWWKSYLSKGWVTWQPDLVNCCAYRWVADDHLGQEREKSKVSWNKAIWH